MTQWGIGFTLLFIGLIYSIIIVGINFLYFPNFRFVIINPLGNIIVGLFIILVGLLLFILPAKGVVRSFYDGKLCTSGIYKYIRHPIYAGWIFVIVPGAVVITGCYLGFTIPLIMYIVFRKLIFKEEIYLENKFGEEYLAYKKNVGSVFPKCLSK